MLKNVCVFCGSSLGRNSIYRDEAEKMGKIIAQNNMTLVYGGGKVGLMGVIADSVLQNGGQVVGVITQKLIDKELANAKITQLIKVETMNERKMLMTNLSDGFITLPGGFGTFDELCEILTLNQLEIINKPCALLNINNYFDYLLKMFMFAVDERLLKQEHLSNLIITDNAHDVIDKMKEYKPQRALKWIEEILDESRKDDLN